MSITNRDIYKSALGLICQRNDGSCADLEERAPYLIAAFCCVAANIDKAVRKTDGLAPQDRFSPVYQELSADFPLCQKLAAAAALYIAAMLVIDENPELSEALYEKYCDSIVPLQALLGSDSGDGAVTPPDDTSADISYAVCESIAERYFYD